MGPVVSPLGFRRAVSNRLLGEGFEGNRCFSYGRERLYANNHLPISYFTDIVFKGHASTQVSIYMSSRPFFEYLRVQSSTAGFCLARRSRLDDKRLFSQTATIPAGGALNASVAWS